MPLLELQEGKSLSDKFAFLHVVGDGTETKPQESRATSLSAQQSLITQKSPASPGTSNNQLAKDGHALLSPDDLTTIGVIKSSTKEHKVFINVTTPVMFLSHRGPGEPKFLCSSVSQDTDKSGNTCLVLTVVDLTAKINLGVESDVTVVLAYVSGVLGQDLSSKWTLPKMRRKGPIPTISLSRNSKSSPVPHTASTQGARPLIAELPTANEAGVSLSDGTSGSKFVQQLVHPIVAMPLPSQYTHQFSLPLPQTRKSKNSWSVYFDGEDDTLKVLVPPLEDFFTINRAHEDFRAFVKDGVLYIFFIFMA